MKILIDNGHGSNTPGKCSPDGRLREYSYTREIAGRVVFELRKLGIDAELVVKEEIVWDRQKPISWLTVCMLLLKNVCLE